MNQLAQVERQFHFYRFQETIAHRNREKNNAAIQLCKQLNQGGLFYWFQFFFLYRWMEMPCYRFPKYLLKTEVLFVFIVSYTNAYYSYSRIRHVFVYWDFLLMQVESDAESEQKIIHKQKQCIENGSHWRAFNGLVSIVYIQRLLRFYTYDRCRALKTAVCFLLLFFYQVIRQAMLVTIITRIYAHTLANKLAKKCEKVLISLIVVGMKRSMHQLKVKLHFFTKKRRFYRNRNSLNGERSIIVFQGITNHEF